MDIEKLAGSRLGDYEIQSLLGRGSMGVAYKAHQLGPDRPVALKILPSVFGTDFALVKVFRRVLQSVMQLHHPNIVEVYDFGEAENLLFFSMEYVDGKTLREILKERGRLGTDEAIRIISQTARALAHAHKHDIIHENVWPPNIIIDEFGNVKVKGFGLARIFEPPPDAMHVVGPILGHVKYWSPELIYRVYSRGPSTDIWSLGVTLYEALAGKPAFDDETFAGVIHKILHEEPEPIHDVREDIPTTLGQVLGKMIQKNPERRYRNMEAVIDDLNAVRSGRAVSAGKRSFATDQLLSFLSKKKRLALQYWREKRHRSTARGKRYAGVSGLVILFLIAYGIRLGISGIKYLQQHQRAASGRKAFSQMQRQRELVKTLQSPGHLSKLLEAAVMGGDVESVRTFLDYGADPNMPSTRRGVSLLHSSIALGHNDIARVLIDKGIDVNAKMEGTGQTPLMLAAARGNTDIVKVLIASGADVNIRDNSGKTALALAQEGGYTEIIHLLKEAEAPE